MHTAPLLRLFLAVAIHKPVCSGIDTATATLRASTPAVRWVRADLLHLTLVFLGERPAEQVDAISMLLGPACAAQRAFDAHIGAFGCFPNAARPRVLWAGLAGGGDALSDLRRAILARLVAAGLAPPDERFSPHLTLGRVPDSMHSTARVDLGRAWIAQGPPALPPVPMRAIELMRSELGPGGPRYTALRSLPLHGR